MQREPKEFCVPFKQHHYRVDKISTPTLITNYSGPSGGTQTLSVPYITASGVLAVVTSQATVWSNRSRRAHCRKNSADKFVPLTNH